jgi:ribosomal protein S18 acetylase RimI-like enzyme
MFMTDAARNALTVMGEQSIRRIVLTSTMGAGDVASFCAVPPDPRPEDWADLARLLGPGELADLLCNRAVPPPDWEPVFTMQGLQPPGWTEISAVCTAPEARGRGYASCLVQALAARIAARGERSFLHVARTKGSSNRARAWTARVLQVGGSRSGDAPQRPLSRPDLR